MEQAGGTTPAVVAAPVPVQERVTAIDVLRGAALFGILTANMRGFLAPSIAYFSPEAYFHDPADLAIQTAVDTLVSGKFITIFATLFGVGFAIQLERARSRGQDLGYYWRRSAWLLVFGLAHGYLLWFGDILHTYAIGGFFLMLFRNKTERSLFRWAIGLYCVPLVIGTGFLIASWFGVKPPAPPEPTAAELARHLRIFGQGTWLEMLRQRAEDFGRISVGLPFIGPRLLGEMLFGAWIWKRGFLRDLDTHRDLLSRARFWGLLIGLPLNIAVMAIQKIYHPNPTSPSLAGWIQWTLASAGVPALSIGYACVILAWRDYLQACAVVGRMALTNYLLQSLICTTIFNAYGLALFGKMGLAAGFALTLVVYGAQIPMSAQWLSRHRFGPVEWLWRRLIYGPAVDSSDTRRAA